jgi:cell division cycle protein 37
LLQVNKSYEIQELSKGKDKDDELSSPKALEEPLSSGAEADVEDGSVFDPEHTEASEWGKKFAEIPTGDYNASMRFVSEHPSILTEKESDALLIMAFDKQLGGKDVFARQCVHQALLIQYCRQLGKDGVSLFFKRVMTKDHQARKLFVHDVNGTYAKMKERVRNYEKERAEESGEVEQIQLHAVDPNTSINIRVPPPIPTDPTAESTLPPPTEQELLGRRIFESFPPGLQRALESDSLDEINKVLGKMSVGEAEDVVAKLSEGGILSVEEGVLDATTEEGQHIVDEIIMTKQMPAAHGEPIVELSEDPPLD